MMVIMICYHNVLLVVVDRGNIFFGGCDCGIGCENNVKSNNYSGNESGSAMDKLQ